MGYIGKVPADVLIDPMVDSAAITDATIVTADLANDAVTSAKLAADSVDSSELINGSVDNAHLAGSIAMNKTNLTAGTGLTLSTDTLSVDAAQTQITSVGTLSSLTLGGDLSVPQKIIHVGDTNTYLSFGDDSLDIVTGGTTGQTIDHGVLYNYTDLVVAEYIKHDGDTDNYIQFGTDTLTISKETTFSGDVVLSKTSDPWITIKRPNASDQINKIGTDSAGLYFQSYGHATGGNNQIIFMTEESDSSSSPTERMRIESQGSVGVGLNTPQVVRNWTAPDSIKVLNVYGSAGSRVAIQGTDASLDLVDYGATANRRWFSIYNNDDSVYFRRLQDDASSYSDILALNLANGNTTIKGKLTIEVENETPLHIRNTSTAGGNNAYLTIENDGGADVYLNFLQGSSNGYIKYRDEAEMVFQTGGMNDRLTVSNSGTTFNTPSFWLLGSSYNAKVTLDDNDYLDFVVGNNGTESSMTIAQSNVVTFKDDIICNGDIKSNATTIAINTATSSTGADINFETGGANRLQINGAGNIIANERLRPQGNNERDLGHTGYRWATVYGVTSDFSSDQTLKKNIATSDLGADFIKSLNPVKFNWKKSFGDDTKKNYGFLAQDIKKTALSDSVSGDEGEMGMNYNQLIAPIVKALQEALNRIEALENA